MSKTTKDIKKNIKRNNPDTRTGWYRNDNGQYIYLQDGVEVNPTANFLFPPKKDRGLSKFEQNRKNLSKSRKELNKGRVEEQMKIVKKAVSSVGDHLVHHPESINEYGKNLTIAQYNKRKKEEHALKFEGFENRTKLVIPEFKP
mgnify:FL=1